MAGSRMIFGHRRPAPRIALVAVAIAALAIGSAGAQPAGAGGPANLALVDVNKASIFELEGLPGVDARVATAIIDGRPYDKVGELVRRKIISQAAYDRIRGRIIASEQGPR